MGLVLRFFGRELGVYGDEDGVADMSLVLTRDGIDGRAWRCR